VLTAELSDAGANASEFGSEVARPHSLQ
jgi:hypothetical protein